MSNKQKSAAFFVVFLSLAVGCCDEGTHIQGRIPADKPAQGAELSRRILANTDLSIVLEKAKSVLGTHLNAGSGYAGVWIRDFNTFIELALQVQERERIREALATFFHFQGEDGNITDGYVLAEQATADYDYIVSPAKPRLRGYKNTVETDQESSLVQAVCKYIEATGDRAFLYQVINGKTVFRRMLMALEYLLHKHYAAGYGLLWGGTTVDWGDVQPEHEWGVQFDRNSHIAIDVYDNAMFIIAIDCLLKLQEGKEPGLPEWISVRNTFYRNVRKHLWDPVRQKFRPHIYLDGSPFPRDFAEGRIHYHGGTAVAIEAGLLGGEEIRQVLDTMRNNVRFAGAATIGLTVFPAYPDGYFKNLDMHPYSYQNGGDWTWIGARMIQQLIAHGYVEEAYIEILPMLERVRRNDGFYEWYTLDNQPRGSGTFRGSAGVLGKAILMLKEWAVRNAG